MAKVKERKKPAEIPVIGDVDDWEADVIKQILDLPPGGQCVYYIDSATPLKWRDWIRQGVESWIPALRDAGYPNAIVVKVAPEPKDDPNFSPEDIRNSVIRWLPTTVENAFGPNIHDPRTGEILNADIEFNQNMLRLARLWYITSTG